MLSAALITRALPRPSRETLAAVAVHTSSDKTIASPIKSRTSLALNLERMVVVDCEVRFLAMVVDDGRSRAESCTMQEEQVSLMPKRATMAHCRGGRLRSPPPLSRHWVKNLPSMLSEKVRLSSAHEDPRSTSCEWVCYTAQMPGCEGLLTPRTSKPCKGEQRRVRCVCR